jgi:hypothetical protein
MLGHARTGGTGAVIGPRLAGPLTIETDWKQFIVSLIGLIVSLFGSLAWPVAVVVVVYLLKDDIRGLFERIEEFSLSGIANVRLRKQVEQVRKQGEIVEAQVREQGEIVQQKLETPLTITLHPDILRLAQEFPEAAVLEANKDMENALLQFRRRLPDLSGSRSYSALDAMKYLVDEKIVPDSALELFQGIRNARNSAVRAKGKDRLTPGEAIELVRQAHQLILILESAVNAKMAAAKMAT